jgi:hypothetical protein
MAAWGTVFRANRQAEAVRVICLEYCRAALRLDRHASQELIKGIRSQWVIIDRDQYHRVLYRLSRSA